MLSSIEQDSDEERLHPRQSSQSRSPSPEVLGGDRRELPNKTKYLTAGAIFYGGIAFGCAFNIYGPAITTLQNKYGTDDATITKCFSFLTGGYMLGALAAGFLFNYINRQFAAIVIILTMAAIVYLTPYCPTLTTFFLSAGILGICSGSYDTCQFVWMMEMMQADCPPYVQGQNFFYAVGTILVSLIMAPFLKIPSDTPSTLLPPENSLSTSQSPPSAPSATKLIIPCTLIGILLTLYALFQILLFIFFRYHPPPPEIKEHPHPSTSSTSSSTSRSLSRRPTSPKFCGQSLEKLRLILLTASFFAAYSPLEISTFQFFPKFAQNSPLHLSESDAAYALSAMTFAYALGRGLAVLLVFRVPAQALLCVNILLVIAADLVFYLFASTSLPCLYTSGILFGLGFSSMYPSFSSYIERHLTITNALGSALLVGGAGVAAVYPLILGSFIEQHPIILSYTTAASIALIVASFGTLSYLTRKNRTLYYHKLED